jgi:hypothetical protein
VGLESEVRGEIVWFEKIDMIRYRWLMIPFTVTYKVLLVVSLTYSATLPVGTSISFQSTPHFLHYHCRRDQNGIYPDIDSQLYVALRKTTIIIAIVIFTNEQITHLDTQCYLVESWARNLVRTDLDTNFFCCTSHLSVELAG